MVRLRSNRWYAADGQRNRQRVAAVHSSGTRRVISLCILLALVILLMQRASDPQHVRNAFQSLGVPLDPVAPAEADTAAGARSQLAEGLAPVSPIASSQPTSTWQATCDDVVPRILDSLTAAQQRSLAEFWFGRSTAPPSEGSPLQTASIDSLNAATADRTADRNADESADADVDDKASAGEWAEQGSAVVEKLAEQTQQSSLSSDDKDKWLTQLEKFSSQWQILWSTPTTEELPAAVSSELQQALTAALDQRLVAGLRDAAPWTQSESLAFWRLLQRTTASRESNSSQNNSSQNNSSQNSATPSPARQHDAAVTPLVSMLQLDAEARALRGRSVRFHGGVRRVERVERTFDPLHIQTGYWVLWLRGEDDAPQPVAVYTTDPLAEQLVTQIDDQDADYPHVEVRGIFGKRVAYASPSGLQVGPALFASQLIPLRSASPPLPAVTPGQLGSEFRIAVAVACLLAALIVLPILWSNRRQANADQPNARGSRPWWLLLLSTTAWPAMIATQPYMASAASPAIDVQTPPWTTASTEPLREFLQVAGVTPFSQAAADAVRVSIRDRSSDFPNTLLKAIDAIRRVGWVDDPRTLEPIDLGGGLSLHGQSLAGWVRAATPVVLSETQRAWFQIDEHTQLYQVELQMQATDADIEAGSAPVTQADAEPASELLTIYCERVPQMWLATARLRQPARFSALALVDSAAADEPRLCALAAAPQWTLPGILPASIPSAELAAQLAPPLPPYLFQLGQLGWDLSNLDIIAQRSQQPLSRAEAAGFYSMLHLSQVAPSAAGSSTGSAAGTSGTVGGAASPATEPQTQGDDTAAEQAMALLANARESVGKPIQWRVRIVTGTLVRVTNPDDQRLLGGQSYIQYDGFVDIGNHRIRFQPAESSGGETQTTPPLEFAGEYPVTIVAPQGDAWKLGEPPIAGQESWSVGQYALVQGRFYRLWSYQSELLKSRSAQARQIAPLVVATHLRPTTPPKRDTPVNVGWFGWAMSAAMIAILAAILWSATRKNRSLPA